MQLLTTIYEKGADPAVLRDDFRQRNAARAVVFDVKGRVALLHVTKQGYHKLPGGGLEGDEGAAKALRRETQEEIGCDVTVQKELGIITEYRDAWGLQQNSHCYVAQVVGVVSRPAFTSEELADGFAVTWAPNLVVAIAMLEADAPANFEGPFILQRDLALLRAAAGYDAH
jgi:ADP-ribose pyrophosphatase YjhB (NUDIX family)